ncbi:MAG: hypothetical protein IPM38_12105 [Ignavibacteria bacterium]|nr:hypothetical protein [Ignavibacteria bacterium]
MLVIAELRDKLYVCIKEKQKLESQRNLFYQAISNKCIFYYSIFENLVDEFKSRGKTAEYQQCYKKEIAHFIDLKHNYLGRRIFPFFLLAYKFREDIDFIKAFGYMSKNLI